MRERRRLAPKTHIIESIRARNLSLEECMAEFVDNSLGHGMAKKVTIIMLNGGGFAVKDDGVGIDDINRLFTIADAGATSTLSNIGQFGVGAKDSSIWLGDLFTVETVHNGRFHTMTVDWEEVRKTDWPYAYDGRGRAAAGQRGTTLYIREPHHWFTRASSDRLARELGMTFGPALRAGTEIHVRHQLKSGPEQVIVVEPFSPADLTDEIEISGEIETKKGLLKWSGRAGLSTSLNDDTNGVHIAFTHRRVEKTREPFGTKSAPTLYCEVVLDATTPWKFALSDHKTRVRRHRTELMESINAQIAELLEKASAQAKYLALRGISLPIQTQLTKGLQAAGVLYVDEEEEPEDGGHGETDWPIVDPNPRPRERTTKPEGTPAKPAGKPTGVQIEFVKTEYLNGKYYSWVINGKQMIIELDEAEFEAVIDGGYPPKHRDREFIRIIAAYLSQAIESEYLRGTKESLTATITPKLYKQIEQWASQKGEVIAPYLNRAILEGATR